MIIEALIKYYDRMAADTGSQIAKPGWEWNRISFEILLRQDGTLVHVEDIRENEGDKFKEKIGKMFLMPFSEKRSNNVMAHLLWDNVMYATGCTARGVTENSSVRHADFVRRVAELADCPSVAPVMKFLSSSDFRERLSECREWEEAVALNSNVTFRIVGQPVPVFNAPDVEARILEIQSKANVSDDADLCMVTGQRLSLAHVHPALHFAGASPTGATLVTFNSASSKRYGRTREEIASMSEIAVFKYITALKTLIASNQRTMLGRSTMVCWSEKDSTLEKDYKRLFDSPPKDNPNANADAVKRLLESVRTGAFSDEDLHTKFYILGLEPGGGGKRIDIRIWHCGTIAEMTCRFADWFENTEIGHGERLPAHLPLWSMLVSLLPPGLTESSQRDRLAAFSGEIMKSICNGTPYPKKLLSVAIRRTKAEGEISYSSAKLIKAFLNRNSIERKLKVKLDKDNTNIGYLCGRLFAVLERAQRLAMVNKKSKATIKERFFRGCMDYPQRFAVLEKKYVHHIRKVEFAPKRKELEGLKEEIYSKISTFPKRFSEEEKGLYCIGYYQQREDFFSHKSDNDDMQEDVSQE